MASICESHCSEHVQKLLREMVTKLNGNLESINFQEFIDCDSKHHFVLTFMAPCLIANPFPSNDNHNGGIGTNSADYSLQWALEEAEAKERCQPHHISCDSTTIGNFSYSEGLMDTCFAEILFPSSTLSEKLLEETIRRQLSKNHLDSTQQEGELKLFSFLETDKKPLLQQQGSDTEMSTESSQNSFKLSESSQGNMSDTEILQNETVDPDGNPTRNPTFTDRYSSLATSASVQTDFKPPVQQVVGESSQDLISQPGPVCTSMVIPTPSSMIPLIKTEEFEEQESMTTSSNPAGNMPVGQLKDKWPLTHVPYRGRPLKILPKAVEKCFSCPLCNKTYSSINGIKYHKKYGHGGNLEPVKCEVCIKTYANKKSLATHIRRFHPHLESY